MQAAIAGRVVCCVLLGAAVGMGGDMAQAQTNGAECGADARSWLAVPAGRSRRAAGRKRLASRHRSRRRASRSAGQQEDPRPILSRQRDQAAVDREGELGVPAELRRHSGLAGALQCGSGLRRSRCGRRGLFEWRQGALAPTTASASGAWLPRAICTPARTCCASSFHRPSRPPPRLPPAISFRLIRRPKRRPTSASRPMSTAGTGVRAL